jgi:hypothetical protein
VRAANADSAIAPLAPLFDPPTSLSRDIPTEGTGGMASAGTCCLWATHGNLPQVSIPDEQALSAGHLRVEGRFSHSWHCTGCSAQKRRGVLELCNVYFSEQ